MRSTSLPSFETFIQSCRTKAQKSVHPEPIPAIILPDLFTTNSTIPGSNVSKDEPQTSRVFNLRKSSIKLPPKVWVIKKTGIRIDPNEHQGEIEEITKGLYYKRQLVPVARGTRTQVDPEIYKGDVEEIPLYLTKVDPDIKRNLPARDYYTGKKRLHTQGENYKNLEPLKKKIKLLVSAKTAPVKHSSLQGVSTLFPRKNTAEENINPVVNTQKNLTNPGNR